MNQQEWQEYNRKVAEIRQVANITLDRAEQHLKQKMAKERQEIIDEATKIATDIIEKKLKDTKPETTETTEPEKPKVEGIEMNEENIKIIKQIGEIQKQKRQKKNSKPKAEAEEEPEAEAEEIEMGVEEEPQIDEELAEPQPDDPNDHEDKIRKAMEPPKIFPPLGQSKKPKEMPEL